MQGYRVEFNAVNLKASEVHREMTLSKMKFAQEQAQTNQKQTIQERQVKTGFRR